MSYNKVGDYYDIDCYFVANATSMVCGFRIVLNDYDVFLGFSIIGITIGVDINTDLLATGIDIENKEITVTANSFNIEDNSGNINSVFETVNGNPVLKAKYIQADKITSLGSVTAGTFNLGNNSFIVDSNGKLSCTGANISGTINAESGFIGGWDIGNGLIGSSSNGTDVSGEGLSLQDSFIKFADSTHWASIGCNVMPSTSGVTGVGRFVNKISNSGYSNYGIYIDVQNATYNRAIQAKGSIITDGIIKGYGYGSITPNTDTLVILGDVRILDTVFLNLSNSGSAIGLPSKSSVAAILGISGSTPFSIRISFICNRSSIYTSRIFGRTTIQTSLNNSNYPYMINHDGNIINDGMAIGAGDCVDFHLIWDGSSIYEAYYTNSN